MAQRFECAFRADAQGGFAIASRVFAVILLTLTCSLSAAAEPGTLRVDYYHTGDAETEVVSLDEMWRQGAWAGSRTRLVDGLTTSGISARPWPRGGSMLPTTNGPNAENAFSASMPRPVSCCG